MNININEQEQLGNTALMLCVYYGDAEILELLLESGADVSKQNKDGKTALDIAESQMMCSTLPTDKIENEEERQKCYETIIRSLKAFTQIIDLDL